MTLCCSMSIVRNTLPTSRTKTPISTSCNLLKFRPNSASSTWIRASTIRKILTPTSPSIQQPSSISRSTSGFKSKITTLTSKRSPSLTPGPPLKKKNNRSALASTKVQKNYSIKTFAMETQFGFFILNLDPSSNWNNLTKLRALS